MEVISSNTKYFLTPSQNIVRGVLEGGKVTNAEFFVNKKNEYTSPSQLNQLMKERTNLALGKVDLREITRPNFADFDIPIDAGKKRRKSTSKKPKSKSKSKSKMSAGAVETQEVDVEAGKKKRKPKMAAGAVETQEVDVEAGRRKPKKGKNMSAGAVETQEVDVEAGKKKKYSTVETSLVKASRPKKSDDLLEAGKKKKRSKSVSSTKSKKSKKSTKSKSKKVDVFGGAPEDKKTSLADIFKHVSRHLATQTSDIIAKGGNPTELIKSDIKFFAKQ